jgi:tetratricopeptide (TPR) repeat protein
VNDAIALAPDSAARHLLHNLRNAKALRQNPLVTNLLKSGGNASEDVPDRVVLSRVAQAVASVLRGLSPHDGNPFDGDRPHRQSEIIRRCLLGSEPYKAVARDLGISLRTLFRDLDGIRLRLAEELPRYAPAQSTVEAAADMFEFELRHSHLLRNMGRFDEALQILDRLSAAASTTVQHARVWNTYAIAQLDAGATDGAVQSVGRARTALGRTDGDADAPAIVTACDIDLTDASIARVHGNTLAAIERYGRAAAASRDLLSQAVQPAIDVYVRAQSHAAIISWLMGDMDRCTRAVDAAWNALEGVADPPESAHYALLSASALVHAVGDGDVAWAIREMSAAAVLAERRGMLHDALMALGWLAGLESRNGNLESAILTSRRTVAIARNTMTGTEFAMLCAAAAENEALIGNAAGALRLIEEARGRVDPDGAGAARLTLGEAGAQLAARNDTLAIAAADKAIVAMQRQGKAVFVGWAYYYKALAHERRGERAQALFAAREALPLLERFGKSPELAGAYDLTARLTGNRRYHASASDLRRLLKG